MWRLALCHYFVAFCRREFWVRFLPFDWIGFHFISLDLLFCVTLANWIHAVHPMPPKMQFHSHTTHFISIYLSIHSSIHSSIHPSIHPSIYISTTQSQNIQDISCPEAVKVDDIDSAAVTSAFEAAKAAFSSAEAGSRASAEAQIDMEVNKSMAAAVGVTLA